MDKKLAIFAAQKPQRPETAHEFLYAAVPTAQDECLGIREMLLLSASRLVNPRDSGDLCYWRDDAMLCAVDGHPGCGVVELGVYRDAGGGRVEVVC